MGDSGRRKEKVSDDRRWKEIVETNYEMLDINAIKHESCFVKIVNTHEGHWYHS